jgi:hypothetical protein
MGPHPISCKQDKDNCSSETTSQNLHVFFLIKSVQVAWKELLYLPAKFCAMNNVFIHHVYFWLKNEGNKEDRDQLVAGLQRLAKAAVIKDFHIGIPAGTNREVIDSSYAVSWMLLFDKATDQDSYQTDPMHLKFIEECSHLWSRVVVYDAIDA